MARNRQTPARRAADRATFVLLGLSAAIFLAGAPGSGAFDLRILIPLYSYPQWYAPTNYLWDDVAQAAGAVPVLAIIDPADGPGPGFPNADYQQGLADLQAGGAGIVGYVDTAFGARDPALMEDDVDAYSAEPRVTGIFLDQGNATAGNLGYYSNICQYIRAKPTLTNIVLNSGPTISEAYLAPGMVDIAMVFEQSTGWPDYAPDPFMADYPPGRFSMLVHTCPTAGEMETNVARAVHRNIGWVYVTDDAMPNPWDTQSAYWTQLVTLVSSYRRLAAVSLQADGSGIAATFDTAPRQPCLIQSGDLGSWSNLTPVLHPEGGEVTITDAPPFAAARSYRLLLNAP